MNACNLMRGFIPCATQFSIWLCNVWCIWTSSEFYVGSKQQKLKDEKRSMLMYGRLRYDLCYGRYRKFGHFHWNLGRALRDRNPGTGVKEEILEGAHAKLST